MNIGWIKYNGAIEIGRHLLSTQGTTDVRTGIFESLLKRPNIQFFLYSRVSKETEKFFETKEGSFFKQRIIIFNKLKIEEKLDLLIIENGPSNTNFGTRIDGIEISSIAVCNSLVSSYHGLVFYLQIDSDLPYIFFPEFFSKTFVNENIRYGNFRSIFKNKRWVVLNTGKNYKLLPKYCNQIRSSYEVLLKNNVLELDRWEVHFSDINFIEGLKIKTNPLPRILYIGGQRSRIKKFKEYYIKPSMKIPIEVYGKWDKSFFEKEGKIKYLGVLEKGKTFEEYNNSFASVIIGNVNYEKLGIVSGRFFEVVCSKTLPLIDKDLAYNTTISDIFDSNLIKQLVISKSEDVINLFNRLKNSSFRIDLIKECLRSLRKFSSEETIEQLLQLYKKYKDFDKELLFEKEENSVQTFIDLFNGREEDKDFSKLEVNDFLFYFYKKNSDEFFNLKKNIFPISFIKEQRCFICGDFLFIKNKKSLQASRMKCQKCKNNVGNVEERIKINLKNNKNFMENKNAF